MKSVILVLILFLLKYFSIYFWKEETASYLKSLDEKQYCSISM